MGMERRCTTHHWDKLNENTTTWESLKKSINKMNRCIYEAAKQREARAIKDQTGIDITLRLEQVSR